MKIFTSWNFNIDFWLSLLKLGVDLCVGGQPNIIQDFMGTEPKFTVIFVSESYVW